MKAWLKAFRLKTLPLSLGGVIIGNALTYGEIKPTNPSFAPYVSEGRAIAILLLSILTAISLQILSNLANDYGDYAKGSDSGRMDRALASGSISTSKMKKAIIILSILSFLCGLFLIGAAFGMFRMNWWIFLGIGLLAIAAAILYTMGKLSYGYKGLGDISVLIFFGLVAVLGTSFLHSESINTLHLLPALAYGLFAVMVLNINNIRDINSDRLSNKFTLPARLGKKKSLFYQLILIITAFALLFAFYSKIGAMPNFLFPLGILAGLHYSMLRRAEDTKAYNNQLRNVSLGALFFAALFAWDLLKNHA